MRAYATMFAIGVMVAACAQEKTEKKVDITPHTAVIRVIAGATPSWIEGDTLGALLWETERAFYESRNDVPAWIDNDQATRQLGTLIDALGHARDHGLDPARYGTRDVQQAIEAARAGNGRFDRTRVPELDARLTYAYLRYAADLLGWSAKPGAIYDQWLVTPKQDDLGARLRRAIASRKVRETLEELAPMHPQYKGLQEALARERRNPTGHLDLIRMNLERWRWMPRDLGDRYILVNVPAYQMQVIEGGRTALAMRTIVGESKNPTPLFSDEMTYVVFSPAWNIPDTIIRKEMVPHIVKDPSYLDRQAIEVVGTSGDVVDLASVDWTDEHAVHGMRFRQAPGPKNALGLVKFIFPNHFDVYLHDTPSRSLFNKVHRALSHGCIRVENPIGLAQYVLRDQPQWTAPRISAAMNAQQEQTAILKQRLPVHIGYWTAWVSPDGSLTYTDDPYKLDLRQAQLEGLSVE